MRSLEEAAGRFKIGEYRWIVQRDTIRYNVIGLLVCFLFVRLSGSDLGSVIAGATAYVSTSIIIQIALANSFLRKLKKYMDKYHAQ